MFNIFDLETDNIISLIIGILIPLIVYCAAKLKHWLSPYDEKEKFNQFMEMEEMKKFIFYLERRMIPSSFNCYRTEDYDYCLFAANLIQLRKVYFITRKIKKKLNTLLYSIQDFMEYLGENSYKIDNAIDHLWVNQKNEKIIIKNLEKKKRNMQRSYYDLLKVGHKLFTRKLSQ